MIRPLLAAVVFAALLLAGCGDSAPNGVAAANKAAGNRSAPAATPDVARVRIETEAGPIVLELDGRRAPLTTANFLAYVDQHRFDGTSFYRAARTPGAQGRGFIQGGIRRNYRLMLAPVAHEPTSTTGLSHRDGTISMARTDPGSAMGNFFITVGAMPQMDAHGRDQGFAAFGRVVEGMDVVRRILAAPTVANAGSGAMRGQMIAAPVRIVGARREQ
ncbi:MAG: peptidyl-prolyl cis-trans isomerase [Sphingomonadales bacterium]|jgi:peptidyl-prolyl cis-trans isomerase A (cyclophilin A)|nr:peptidyl-prolyl cis-trans isomerase [Sphingomonadales bacterium]